MTLPQPQADTVSALASLAHQQSRSAVVYAQFAAEARRLGMDDRAARWAALAAKLRDDADWNIGKARDRKAFRVGREHTEHEEQDV